MTALAEATLAVAKLDDNERDQHLRALIAKLDGPQLVMITQEWSVRLCEIAYATNREYAIAVANILATAMTGTLEHFRELVTAEQADASRPQLKLVQ